MKIGAVNRFRYEPEWNGNRDLPEGERIGVTIHALRAIDVLLDTTDEDLRHWREEVACPADLKDELMAVPLSTLRLLRLCVNHTTEIRGFEFEGLKEPVTDPLEAFLRLPYGADTLLAEIVTEINRASTLSEDDLGNSESPSAGTPTPTTGSATGAEEGDDPESADTTKEATAQ